MILFPHAVQLNLKTFKTEKPKITLTGKNQRYYQPTFQGNVVSYPSHSHKPPPRWQAPGSAGQGASPTQLQAGGRTPATPRLPGAGTAHTELEKHRFQPRPARLRSSLKHLFLRKEERGVKGKRGKKYLPDIWTLLHVPHPLQRQPGRRHSSDWRGLDAWARSGAPGTHPQLRGLPSPSRNTQRPCVFPAEEPSPAAQGVRDSPHPSGTP